MALLTGRAVRNYAIRLAALCAACCVCMQAGAQSFNEYQLKAVFLFRFTGFVEWPANTATADAFPICVIGSDPFQSYLDDAIRGETVQGRPVVARRYANVDDAKDCRIAFISRSEQPRLPQIVRQLRERGILTVGDSERFAEEGGMIELVTADKRVRLEINVDAARAANLQISSKLLRPATIVQSRG